LYCVLWLPKKTKDIFGELERVTEATVRMASGRMEDKTERASAAAGWGWDLAVRRQAELMQDCVTGGNRSGATAEVDAELRV
jgi:hypothetical protein